MIWLKVYGQKLIFKKGFKSESVGVLSSQIWVSKPTE